MKFCICNELFFDRSFEAACAHAKSLGYQGIEIAPFTLGDNGSDWSTLKTAKRRELHRIASDHGLQIVGLHWLLAKTEGLHLTTSDKLVRDRTFNYLRDLVGLCADLGGTVMVLGSPLQRNLESGTSFAEASSRACELIQQLSPELKDSSITLAIEPLGPEETNFLTTARSAAKFVERIGSEWVGVTLDVKAMSTESDPIPEIIEAHQKWLRHFHANDPNRRGPGMGQVDFAPIGDALRRIGYSGWVSVEVFDYSPGVEVLAAESMATLKKHF